VNRFFKIKKHITITIIAVIEVVNVLISIIFDRNDTKKSLKGIELFKLPGKSKLMNGANKNAERMAKCAATKLHKTITQNLSL
jgi:hypothetical protein